MEEKALINFGNALKSLRMEKGLKAVEVAEELGVSKSTLCHLEQGTRGPSAALLVSIARFFGVGIDVLFKEEKKDEPTLL